MATINTERGIITNDQDFTVFADGLNPFNHFFPVKLDDEEEPHHQVARDSS